MSKRMVRTGISYFGNRNPRHFVVDLEEILTHNCNFIVHTFSENDQEYYKDTIKELISLSKNSGLKCYLDPWGVGRVFGGEAYSTFALKNRDTCQILPDGELAPAVCLNNLKFKRFMKNWIKDAAEIGADVLFWDEPHFYFDFKNKSRFALWYCICESCNNKFKEKYGIEINEANEEQIVEFKEQSIVNFLTELCDSAKDHKMKNALCMLPVEEKNLGLADWSKAAAIKSLDIFGTDPYWIFFKKDLHQFVGDYARKVKQLCDQYGKEPQIWIQAYKIPSGREEELKEAVAVAYAEGIRNFAAWSYYGTAYMSYIRSDNPQKVWDILGEVYGEILQGSWD